MLFLLVCRLCVCVLFGAFHRFRGKNRLWGLFLLFLGVSAVSEVFFSFSLDFGGVCFGCTLSFVNDNENDTEGVWAPGLWGFFLWLFAVLCHY